MPASTARADAKGLADVHAAAVDVELADLFVVRRAAHLEDGEAAAHLAEELDVAEQNDGVADRRYVRLGDRGA